MATLTVKSEGADKVITVLHALSAGVTQRQVNAGISPAVKDVTNTNFEKLISSRHRPGVAQNFWKGVRDDLKWSDLLDGIEMRSDVAGAAQRYYGGTIKAVNPTHLRGGLEIPLLWIPVSPASEGKAAGEFKGLVPIYSTLTSKGVAVQHEKGKKLKDEPVLFALVPEVTQNADPSVLPTDDEYAAAIATAVDELLATYASPGGSTP